MATPSQAGLGSIEPVAFCTLVLPPRRYYALGDGPVSIEQRKLFV